MPNISAKSLKVAGLALILIPTLFLFIFTVGETLSGDPSGLSHLVQAAPLIILGALAWKKPFIGGIILTVGAAALFLAYLFAFHGPISAKIITSSLLFLPPAIAGILFIAVSGKTPPKS